MPENQDLGLNQASDMPKPLHAALDIVAEPLSCKVPATRAHGPVVDDVVTHSLG